jgi:hypothetical protein
MLIIVVAVVYALLLCWWCMRSCMQVSYLHLSKAVPILAIWLADAPKDMLELMDEVVNRFSTTTIDAYSTTIRLFYYHFDCFIIFKL